MEIEPENSGLLHFLGKINLDQEQFHDAGRIYSKLNELEPENIENLLALRNVYSWAMKKRPL